MDRKLFIESLRKAEPALSTKDGVAAYACFCFGEAGAYTYDGTVSLELPYVKGAFNPPIRGGVTGRTLLDFLSASRAKELEIKQAGAEVTIKAGRARLAFPAALGVEDFTRELGAVKGGVTVKTGKAFMAGMAKAAAGMGRDPATPWRFGVTLAAHKAGVALYSTDNKTATRYTIKGERAGMADDFAALLSPRFCELLLGAKALLLELKVAPAMAVATYEDGLRLYGPTIKGAAPGTYEQLFAEVAYRGNLTPPPPGLDRCLERAAAVARTAREPYTRLIVKAARLYLETRAEAGHVDDSIAFEHEDCEAVVIPEVLGGALLHAEGLVIQPDKGCVYIKGPGYTHLVTLVKPGGSSDDPARDQEQAGAE